MIHPLIGQFQAHADVLDALASNDSLDDAVVRLATWMEIAGERVTEDDRAVLISIGACSIGRALESARHRAVSRGN